jgi:hypothetical protein
VCPSVKCPNCNQLTFHRGTCESKDCGYDPLDATIDLDHLGPINLITSLPKVFRGLYIEVREKPFYDIRISHTDDEVVQEVADAIHYTGPFFHHDPDPEDALDLTGRYGFDLVKKNADAALALAP